MSAFTESVVEDASLAWLGALGFTVKHGPEIAADEPMIVRCDLACRYIVQARRLQVGTVVNHAEWIA